MESSGRARADEREAFGLGPWRVEPGLDLVVGPGGPRALEPREMDLLVCLARHAGETVTKATLLEEVWKGAFVVESVIAKTVFGLRQALGDDAASPRFVLTVPRRGYRLIVDVRRSVDPAPEAARGAGEDRSGAAPTDDAVPAAPAVHDRSRRRVGSAVAVALLAALAALLWLRVTGARRPLDLRKLAVPPFEDLDRSETGRRLAVALRSELLGELVRLERPRIFLLESGAVGQDGALAAARSIGADSVLLGRVESMPERIRVDLEVVDAADGELRWSSSVERPTRELFALRRQLAADVVERFGTGDRRRAPAAEIDEPPIGADAYRRFLEARFLWSRRGLGDLDRAHDLFLGIARDAPGFAAGHAWLALSEVTRVNYLGKRDPVAILEQGERSASRALELDPSDPVAQVAAGLVELNLHCRADRAIESYRRAVDLAPSFAPAHQFLAEALSIAGRHDAAVAQIDEAVALEPFSPVMHGVRGLVLQAAGRPHEAIEALDRALVLEPKFYWLHHYRGFALIRLGDPRAAAEAFVVEAEGYGRNESHERLERRVAAEGLAGFWRWRVEELTGAVEAGLGVRPTELAEALAAVGRDEEALSALARAADAGDGEFFLHYRSSPAFDRLRDDLRFQRIYARFGL